MITLHNEIDVKKIFIILILSLWGIILCGQSVPLVTSVFSNDTEAEGWQGGWRTVSTIDGISEGDWYMRLPVGINPGNRGSKLISHNPTAAWTGNFISKGVTGISLDFANWSESDPAYLRIAISNMANAQQSGGTWWVSNVPIYFAPESGWGAASFLIDSDNMHRVGNLTGDLGTDTFNETLADIKGFRILSSTLGLAAIGDEFYGYVGMDNIQLTAIPEPNFMPMFMIILLSIFLMKIIDQKLIHYIK